MNLLIDESPLVLLPSLAQRIGLDEAIVVQQVHYLVNANANVENSRAYQDNCYWVFNSIEQWQKKYFKWWSVPTVKRVFQGLTECDLLITKTFGGGKNHNRLWYRVNHSLIQAISETPLSDFPQNRNDRIKMIRSKWSDQNDPVKTEVSDHFDPVVSDQNDPVKTEVSDHFDPSSIYKRSISNKDFPIKETPPYPQEGETEAYSIEVEILDPETNTKPIASEQPKPEATQKNDNPSLGQNCAATLQNEYTQLSGKNPATGKEYLPWQVMQNNRVVDNPEFVSFVAKALVQKYDFYKAMKLSLLGGEVKKYVRKAQDLKSRLEEIWDFWEEFTNPTDLPDKTVAEVKTASAMDRMIEKLAERGYK